MSSPCTCRLCLPLGRRRPALGSIGEARKAGRGPLFGQVASMHTGPFLNSSRGDEEEWTDPRGYLQECLATPLPQNQYKVVDKAAPSPVRAAIRQPMAPDRLG